jgi:hypothetical protein
MSELGRASAFRRKNGLRILDAADRLETLTLLLKSPL